MELKSKRKIEVLLVVIIIFAYILISYLLIRQRYSLWYDELFTLEVVKADISRSILLMIGDGKPPLYYILVKIYSVFTGINSVDLLRLSSVILGIPFTLYVYKICKEFIKSSFIIPFIITFFLATNPLFLSYTIEYRPYTMLASVTMIYLYYFYKSVVLKEAVYYKKFFFSKILLLLTSYVGLFLLMSEVIYRAISLKGVTLKKIFDESKLNVLIIGITSVLVFLQINIFHNFSTLWLKGVNITSVFNSFLITIFGTDPGKPFESYPFNIKFDVNTLLVLSILFYVLVILLVYLFSRLVKSNIKHIFSLVLINFLIVFVISTDISPLKFYLERYIIGILLSFNLIFLLSLSEISKKIFLLFAIIFLFINSLYITNVLGRVNRFEEPGKYSKEYIDYYFNYRLNKCGSNVFEQKRIKCGPEDLFKPERLPIYK